MLSTKIKTFGFRVLQLLRENWFVIPVIIGRSILYAAQGLYCMTSDSYAYISFETAQLLKLCVSNARPPLYPVFIDALSLITGQDEPLLLTITAIQIILSLCSVVLFKYAVLCAADNKSVANWAALFYGLQPAVSGWDKCILTESFALTGTVLFLLLILMYLKEERPSIGIACVLSAFLLVFLRPQFLTYLAMLAVFLIIKLFLADRAAKRGLYQMFTTLGICSLIVVGYCTVFYYNTGIFSLTDASVRQNLVICIRDEYYKWSEDSEFVYDVSVALHESAEDDGNARAWEVTGSVLEKYRLPKCSELTQECLKAARRSYLRDRMECIIDTSQSRMFGYSGYTSGNNISKAAPQIIRVGAKLECNIFEVITIAQVLMIALIEGIVMMIAWITKRKPPFVHMGLFAFSVVTAYSAFFITCGEYMRTMITVLPFIYLILAVWINRFCSLSCDAHDAAQQ